MKKLITDTVIYVGVNDHEIDLFEGQYVVPDGMAYNSYMIDDDKVALLNTADEGTAEAWLANVEETGLTPDYLIVQHMEPDHSAAIEAFMQKYPDATVVGNAKTFRMLHDFFPEMEITNRLEVTNGQELNLGTHCLKMIFAPMVHWPEVMMVYDTSDQILYSADAFGKFGALDKEDDDWACEARRYYFGIVGKYGAQVQSVLKKAAALNIQTICPLHGPILTENLGYYLDLYDKWSAYEAESAGVVICYTSVYGHTKKAAEMLQQELEQRGVPAVALNDLARCDMAEAVEDAFRYDMLVLATTTYNAELFPFMRQFIDELKERNYQNRRVAFMENGSWAPTAGKIMKQTFESMKNIRLCSNRVTIHSALDQESEKQLHALAEELSHEYGIIPEEKNDAVDPTALFKIGYGLYVVTCNDGTKDNGLIVNSVSQVSDHPYRVAVNINKVNYSCNVIKKTGTLNVCTLDQEVPFRIFEHFGFQSGRDVDKFSDFEEYKKSGNGLPYLSRYANGFISLKVFDTVDLGTHWMFLCDVTETAVISDVPSVTYDYYQKNIKPQPEAEKKGWVCTVCGYVYEGDELPDDFVCPLCKHGASDFERIQ